MPIMSWRLWPVRMIEIDRVRDRYPSTKRVALDILGVRLAVRTNDDRVASRMAAYFAPYVSPHEVPLAPTLFVLLGDPILDPDRLHDVALRRPRQGFQGGVLRYPRGPRGAQAPDRRRDLRRR